MYKLDNNVEWTEELKNAFKTGTTRAKIIYDGDEEINETNCLKQLELKDTQYVPGLGIIGQAVSKELSFSFVNKEGINLENQEVTLKIGAEYNGDVYYITYGNFIVYEAPKNDNTNEVTSVVANDYMKKFDIPYEDSMTYPCTLRELTEDVCQKVGVELGSESFTNEDFIVVDNQFAGKTAREVIQNVAKSAFSWARIGQDNKLYFDFEANKQEEIIGSHLVITDASSTKQASITELKGNTSQEGTPTPSSPVEVQTVSGDNNIVVSNKNLIDFSTFVYGYVATNGTINTGHPNSEMASPFFKCKPNTTYTFSVQETTDTYSWWIGIGEYNSRQTFIKRDVQQDQSYYTFTTGNTTEYIRVSARNLVNATKVQLEKGNQPTTYLAHQGNSYRVDLGGKNKFNFNDTYYSRYTTTTLDINGNTLTTTNSNNRAAYIWWHILAEPNTTYTISYGEMTEATESSYNRIWYQESDTIVSTYTQVSATVLDKTNKYATFTSSKKYIIVGIRVLGNSSNSVSNIQLEKRKCSNRIQSIHCKPYRTK